MLFLIFAECYNVICTKIGNTGRISLSVGRQLPKLDRRVRLPYPAFRIL